MRLQSLFPSVKGLAEIWRARLLAAILMLGIPVTLALNLVILFSNPIFSVDVTLMISTLALELAVWLVWSHMGLNPATFLFVIGIVVLNSISIYYSGGIASVGLTAQAFILMIAALLTTPWFNAAIFGLMTLFNYAIIAISQSQTLPSWVLNDGPMVRFSIQTGMLLISAGTVLFSNRIIRALTQNLANSEYRFRALFEQTSDAVFITGLNLDLIEVNDQAAKLLGYQPAEMVGLPMKRLFSGDEWPDVQKQFEHVKKAEFLPPTPRRFLNRQGQELMLETNLSLVQDELGKPLHYQSTGRDVTQKMMEEQRIRHSLVQLTAKATTDSLTGLLNREAIFERANAEWERHLQESESLGLMMLDMDHLKKFNDTYGHLAGDQALQAVARVIETHKRQHDWAGRIGGDEFLVILPGAKFPDALAIARRMEAVILDEEIKAAGKSLPLSCSIGVASTEGSRPAPKNLTELLERADADLYRSKKA